MKKIKNHIRASSLIIENLDYVNTRKPWKPTIFSKENEQRVISRIRRTWPINKRIYEDIFKEKMLQTEKMNYFAISEVLPTLRVYFDNIREFTNSIFVYDKKNYKSVKLYHNFTTLEKVADFMKKFPETDPSGVFFDDEIILNVPGTIKSHIKPDATILRWNNLYFFEIDMWNESFDILRKKDEDYIKVINELKGNYSSIRVYFFSKWTRILNIKKRNVFRFLDANLFIEYYEA